MIRGMTVPVSVTFLGGLGEIGRNCACIEQDGALLIVDCGLMFPNIDMPGVDLVLPDFTYLLQHKKEIVGCVLTHGHEDHTGALSYLLRETELDIYGSELTLGLAKNRIEEAGLSSKCRLEIASDGEVKKIGPFEVEFIPVTHSVPHSFAVSISTAQGVIFHTGDFKLDLRPVDGRKTDLGRIGAIAADPGIRLLLSDSTNAEEEGHTESERVVRDALVSIFATNQDSRLVVACFASHIHRVQQIADVARQFGRRVFTLGRSMGKNVALARSKGILNIEDSWILDIEEVGKYPATEVCVLSTGSQGEPMSALSLMASGESKWLNVGENDLVVISADVIPGNETAVGKVIDNLFRRGATVIHPGHAKVHTSGHAKRDELRTILSIARPRSFVPVHGEFRHLTSHARLAIEMGVPPEGVLLAQDGDSVVLTDNEIAFGEDVPAGYLYVDGVVGDISHGVLRDRRTLAEEGVVVVAVTIDISSRDIVGEPEIVSRGWIHDEDARGAVEEAKAAVRSVVSNALSGSGIDKDAVSRQIRKSLGKFINVKTKRKPMIIPVITEI